MSTPAKNAMHGPEKGNYENAAVFKTVAPNNDHQC